MTMTRRAVLKTGCGLAALGAVSVPAVAVKAMPAIPNRNRTIVTTRISETELSNIVFNHALWLENPNLGQCADLSNVDLSCMCLNDVSLQGANLSCARMDGTKFISVDLRSANLTKANLKNAHLIKCHLDDANFSGAHMANAEINCFIENVGESCSYTSTARMSFRFTDLEGVQFTGLPNGIDFDHANLARTDFKKSQLGMASFVRADLSEANLSQCVLTHCNLTDATLINANLNAAVLIGNDLTNANLSSASLIGAGLQLNNMTSINLRLADLRCCSINDNHYSESLIRGLTGPNTLGCQIEGAILNGYRILNGAA